ncbi:hypothetical protein [Streptomyces sp. NPDC088246]|uniref:hypothetical protein n=1 Tax=Streptomyces sp. NPDC088246 TaxID=3365842 RepID=UPI003826DE0A
MRTPTPPIRTQKSRLKWRWRGGFAQTSDEPAAFDPAPSDLTASALTDTLAATGPKAPTATRSARIEARAHARKLAGAPDAADPLIVHLDGALMPPTPTSGMPLRPGNADSNTAADHIETTWPTLDRPPKRLPRGRRTPTRTRTGAITTAHRTCIDHAPA